MKKNNAYIEHSKYPHLKKHLFIIFTIFFLLFAFALTSQAASYYIRAEATGSGNGTDWINAYTTLPDTLNRGDTYYIADGNYGPYIFNDPTFGSTVITIKKATLANHGTDNGWRSSYGDGQAIFSRSSGGNVLTFQSAYYVIDGQTGGGPNSWQSGHGLKVTATGKVASSIKLVYLSNMGSRYDVHHLTFKHIDFAHRGVFGSTPVGDDIIYNAFGKTPIHTNKNVHDIIISYCYLHHPYRTILLTGRGYNWTLEYSYISVNHAEPAQHSEAWADYGTDRVIIRYNMFADTYGTGIIVWKENYNEHIDSWEIYGNVFFRRKSTTNVLSLGVGAICNTSLKGGGGGAANVKVYNNTFYNLTGNNSGVNLVEDPSGTYNNIQVYNNLWVDCVKAGFKNTINENNQFVNTLIAWGSMMGANSKAMTGENADNWFHNILSENFNLKQPTIYGKLLSTTYANDMYGVIRGLTDGLWDVGALEFSSDPQPVHSSAPPPVKNLTIKRKTD